MYCSDTATHYANTSTYCKRCGHGINYCVCTLTEDDFLEVPPEKKLKIKPNKIVYPLKPIIKLRPMHSRSGMKGINLLKKLDKK